MPKYASPATSAKRRLRDLIRRTGFDIVRHRRPDPLAPPVDCDDFTRDVIEKVRPFTLTSAERIMALVESVRYVIRADIEGALAECGVWRGGSMMVVALTLEELGVRDRDLYLFDTFTHMPDPGEFDQTHKGVSAEQVLAETVGTETYAFLPYEVVVANLASTGYPRERMHFVQGMVEDTVPGQAPERLALCRLDTDWYESTAHEMRHLYPRVAPGGVLIVDDYGEFMGAKKAVDEYFAQNDPVLLNRIDFTGRLVVKS